MIVEDVLAEVKLPKTSHRSVQQYHILIIDFVLGYKWSLNVAVQKLELPNFPELIRHFLYDQIYPDAQISSSQVSIDACPVFDGKISIFYNASMTFRAPSDPSGPSGMRHEYICATPSWRNGHARHDCIFINAQPELVGMRGLEVARVFLFFFICPQGYLLSLCPCPMVLSYE